MNKINYSLFFSISLFCSCISLKALHLSFTKFVGTLYNLPISSKSALCLFINFTKSISLGNTMYKNNIVFSSIDNLSLYMLL